MKKHEKMKEEFPLLRFQCISLSWPPGWNNRIKQFLSDLSAIQPGVNIEQIKTKFGFLRIYVNSNQKDVQQLVSVAELNCNNICHICGNQANSQNRANLPICKNCKE